MPFVATPITIPEAVKPIFSRISKSSTLPICQVQRANIIIMAAQGLSNMQISKQVGLTPNCVSKWRHRFIEHCHIFCELETQNHFILEDAVTVFLSDKKRAGRPSTFTDLQIIRILEIACRNPIDYGQEASHWSLNQLVDTTLNEGIVDSISRKTISRFLKYGENPPSSHTLLASFVRENRIT